MHQSIEVVWCEDEAVAGGVIAPAAEEQVSAQAVLQRARQVLVENRVQVVVIGTLRKEKGITIATEQKKCKSKIDN